MTVQIALLPDGRLHLQHGPIDLLCRAWGDERAVRAAYAAAATVFPDVLPALCAELPALRARLSSPAPTGSVARAMHAACLPFAAGFITPMAAVAGAVADAMLAVMREAAPLERGFVNNGGDIAFHLADGQTLRCGLVTDLEASTPLTVMAGSCPAIHAVQPELATITREAGSCTTPWMAGSRPAMTMDGSRPAMTMDGSFLLTAEQPSRGIATSGRACKGQGGRSFSLGIADSVTVLARTAAQADAAATIVGNAVDLPGHPAIQRRRADTIDPESDLGPRLVTTGLGPLTPAEITKALDAGRAVADGLRRAGLIDGAVLALRGRIDSGPRRNQSASSVEAAMLQKA